MKDVVWDAGLLKRNDRTASLRQRGGTVWLTGLPASGKSTIASHLEHRLVQDAKRWAYRLDGDNVRHGLNQDLGFRPEDRTENIRRVSEVAKLFADAGAIVITSFISPYEKDRLVARQLHEAADLPFYEVFVDTPLDLAEQRDPKGLYAKARQGLIKEKEFTGVSATYEAPTQPDLRLKTTELTVAEAVDQLYDLLKQKNHFWA